MTKEEKKELNKKKEEEQRNLEKAFHKTAGGKLVKVVAFVSCAIFIFGLLLMCSYHMFNLNQSVQNLASNCIEYGGEALFFIAMIYCIFLPTCAKEEKEKDSKKE